MENAELVLLNNYEMKQVREIKQWKREEPGVVSMLMGKVVAPFNWVLDKMVPTTAIEAALNISNIMARLLADERDILRDAGLTNVYELRNKNLELSDKLANDVHNWAIGLAATEGGITGAIGLPGIVADIPGIITLALRTIHKIGLCYGYEMKTDQDRQFVYGIMSVGGANSLEEKTAALALLNSVESSIGEQTLKKMAGVAASKKAGSEAVSSSIRSLAKQLGINLTERKGLQAIPAIGAAIGCSVNAWYIKEVGWAARRAFQERWLIDNRKVTEI
ncbi:MAG: EcsC family protein [Candidatus Saccharibacteria bacterium]